MGRGTDEGDFGALQDKFLFGTDIGAYGDYKLVGWTTGVDGEGNPTGAVLPAKSKVRNLTEAEFSTATLYAVWLETPIDPPTVMVSADELSPTYGYSGQAFKAQFSPIWTKDGENYDCDLGILLATKPDGYSVRIDWEMSYDGENWQPLDPGYETPAYKSDFDDLNPSSQEWKRGEYKESKVNSELSIPEGLTPGDARFYRATFKAFKNEAGDDKLITSASTPTLKFQCVKASYATDDYDVRGGTFEYDGQWHAPSVNIRNMQGDTALFHSTRYYNEKGERFDFAPVMPGKYTAVVSFTSKEIESGNYNLVHDHIVPFAITKRRISKPIPASLVFECADLATGEGKEQEAFPELDQTYCEFVPDAVKDGDAPEPITSKRSAKDTGNYEACFKLKDPATCMWEGESEDAERAWVPWSVSPREFEPNSSDIVYWGPAYDNETTSLTYSGQPVWVRPWFAPARETDGKFPEWLTHWSSGDRPTTDKCSAYVAYMKADDDYEGLIGYHENASGNLEPVSALSVVTWRNGVYVNGEHRDVSSGEKVWYKIDDDGEMTILAVQNERPAGTGENDFVIARDFAYVDHLGVRDAGSYMAFAFFDNSAGFVPSSEAAVAAIEIRQSDTPRIRFVESEGFSGEKKVPAPYYYNGEETNDNKVVGLPEGIGKVNYYTRGDESGSLNWWGSYDKDGNIEGGSDNLGSWELDVEFIMEDDNHVKPESTWTRFSIIRDSLDASGASLKAVSEGETRIGEGKNSFISDYDGHPRTFELSDDSTVTTAGGQQVPLDSLTTKISFLDADGKPVLDEHGNSARSVSTGGKYTVIMDIFTSDYSSTRITGSLTIERSEPDVPDEVAASYGQALHDTTLPDGWSWIDDAQEVGEIGDHTFKANYKPTGEAAKNYKPKENVDVVVSVRKADPKATVSELSATYGQTLSDIGLPDSQTSISGTWTWNDASASVGSVGPHIFKANFTPDDTAHYNSIDKVDVTVIVKKAVVDTPDIAVKYYNGETQVADVPEDLRYIVTKNDGGTEIGDYDVELTLTDPDNYRWIGGDEPTSTLKFRIAADNENIVIVKLDGWVYGETPNEPTATASFGAETAVYSYADSEDGTYSTEVPKNAGVWYVKASIAATEEYIAGEGVAKFEIEKATPTSALVLPKDSSYDGTPHHLATADLSSLEGGTMKYALRGESESGVPAEDEFWDEIPTATDAGGYEIWYKVAGDANHDDLAAVRITATIAKAIPSVITPKAINPSYNGKEQPLVSAGSADGGEIWYSADNETFAKEIPTAVEPGRYDVWYKVVGDANHDDIDTRKVEASIGTPDISKARVVLDQTSFEYDGNAKTPAVVSVILNGSTLTPDTDYTVSYKNNVNVGIATAIVTGQGKYSGTAVGMFTISGDGGESENFAEQGGIPVTSDTHFMTTGTYKVSNNVTIGPDDRTGNGIWISSGATVFLYIEEGATLTVTGEDGNDEYCTPGRAAIRLSNDSTLIVSGQGTLNARGGKASNGAAGQRAGESSADAVIIGFISTGDGGAGGFGGGGAGAGIGTDGGWGGAGGDGGTGRWIVYQTLIAKGSKYQQNYYGYAGKAGAHGSPAESGGTVIATGSVTVNASGGASASGGAGGGRGLYKEHHGGDNAQGCGTSGGGGGGAGGGAADGIGCGGSGGGGGGGGASASIDGEIAFFGLADLDDLWGYGGNGGSGVNGGGSGSAGDYGASNGGDDTGASKKYARAGGPGGSGTQRAEKAFYTYKDVSWGSSPSGPKCTSNPGDADASRTGTLLDNLQAYKNLGGCFSRILIYGNGGMFSDGIATTIIDTVPGETLVSEIKQTIEYGRSHKIRPERPGYTWDSFTMSVDAEGVPTTAGRLFYEDNGAPVWTDTGKVLLKEHGLVLNTDLDDAETPNVWTGLDNTNFHTLWTSNDYHIRYNANWNWISTKGFAGQLSWQPTDPHGWSETITDRGSAMSGEAITVQNDGSFVSWGKGPDPQGLGDGQDRYIVGRDVGEIGDYVLAGWTTDVDAKGNPTGAVFPLKTTVKDLLEAAVSTTTLYAVWTDTPIDAPSASVSTEYLHPAYGYSSASFEVRFTPVWTRDEGAFDSTLGNLLADMPVGYFAKIDWEVSQDGENWEPIGPDYETPAYTSDFDGLDPRSDKWKAGEYSDGTVRSMLGVPQGLTPKDTRYYRATFKMLKDTDGGPEVVTSATTPIMRFQCDKASYDPGIIEVRGETSEYDGQWHAESVNIEQLPGDEKIISTTRYYDESGNRLRSAPVMPGDYTAIVSFDSKEIANGNYNSIDDRVAPLIITKRKIPKPTPVKLVFACADWETGQGVEQDAFPSLDETYVEFVPDNTDAAISMRAARNVGSFAACFKLKDTQTCVWEDESPDVDEIWVPWTIAPKEYDPNSEEFTYWGTAPNNNETSVEYTGSPVWIRPWFMPAKDTDGEFPSWFMHGESGSYPSPDKSSPVIVYLKDEGDYSGIVGYHEEYNGELSVVSASSVYVWMCGVDIDGVHRDVASGEKVWYKIDETTDEMVVLGVQDERPAGAGENDFVIARDLAYVNQFGVKDAGTYLAIAFFAEGDEFTPVPEVALSTVEIRKVDFPKIHFTVEESLTEEYQAPTPYYYNGNETENNKVYGLPDGIDKVDFYTRGTESGSLEWWGAYGKEGTVEGGSNEEGTWELDVVFTMASDDYSTPEIPWTKFTIFKDDLDVSQVSLSPVSQGDTKTDATPNSFTATYDGYSRTFKLSDDSIVKTESGRQIPFEDLTVQVSFLDEDDNPVLNEDGEKAHEVTDAGKYKVVVDVSAGKYSSATINGTLTIDKADPDTPAERTATRGQTLADVPLPDGWAWVNDTQSVGDVGSRTFKANYTPAGDDVKNYNVKSNVDISVSVDQEEPTAIAPSVNAVYGETLSDVPLPNLPGNTPGRWTWVAAPSTSVGEAGLHTFKANFTPDDAAQYWTKNNVDVVVTVKKAVVPDPEIPSKRYTGQNQMADVLESPLYTVTENEGGIEAGDYDVVLTLTEPGNYRWIGNDNASNTLKFHIAAEDENVVLVKLDGWTYGEVPNTPTSTATFGVETVSYTYSDAVDGDYFTEIPKNAGVWYVKGKVEATESYGAGEDITRFEISKALSKPATIVVKDKTYDGTAQQLLEIDESTLQGGTMLYALGEAADSAPASDKYGSSVPSATDVGTYHVWFKVAGDANHDDFAPTCATVSIGKGTPVVTEPKATKPSYNGEAQALITAGSAEGGEILYSLDNKTFGKDIPTAIEPGEYEVWYKVKGDANHEDTEAQKISTTIEKGDIAKAEVSLDQTSVIYDGKAKEPTATVKLYGKTLREGSDYKVEYADNTAIGTATVTITGIGNYAGTLKTSFTIVEGKEPDKGKDEGGDGDSQDHEKISPDASGGDEGSDAWDGSSQWPSNDKTQKSGIRKGNSNGVPDTGDTSPLGAIAIIAALALCNIVITRCH